MADDLFRNTSGDCGGNTVSDEFGKWEKGAESKLLKRNRETKSNFRCGFAVTLTACVFVAYCTAL